MGTIDVQPAGLVACPGDNVTFTLIGVEDTGGMKRANCQTVPIPPEPVSFVWTLTLPPNYPDPLPPLTGQGSVVRVIAKVPGAYSCTLTANLHREDCRPWPSQETYNSPIVRVPDLVSVEWRTHTGNAGLSGCPNNGGQRIFPDWISPTDNPNPADLRRKVDLVARISPAKAGCTVYFTVWDVDDPFDQNNSTMPNVSLIDSNTSGPDNRPTPEPPAPLTGTADAFGEAIASSPFVVSMQPGNNYRAGAAESQTLINTVTQTQADANTPPQYVKFTDMLTVWRKLHVEVDSMSAPDFTNTQVGIIPSAPTYNAANGRATIPLAALEPDFNETDQHKVGRIDILTIGSFVTVATTKAPSPTVEIINAPANIAMANGLWYNLWDDDAGSVPPFVMVGFDAPPVTLPKVPDTGLMPQVFKDAYVEIAPLDMASYQATTVFQRNARNNDEAVTKGNENRSLTSASDFWVVHITSAFQGYVAKDGDPDTEQAAAGLQYGITGVPFWTPWRRAGSLVFLETIRDDKRGNASAMAVMERYTVTHEAGHQFKLEHSDGYAPPDGPAGDYIMSDITDQTGMAPNVSFGAICLKKIREIEYPPQP